MEITKNKGPKIAVLTVTYGNRWKFLSRVADLVIADPYIFKFIIVDNASVNAHEIRSFAAAHSEKVEILSQKGNIGSAGGFAAGLLHIRALPCDYVLLLDDDNVPEHNFSKVFLEQMKKTGDRKAIILGNRSDLKENEKMFYGSGNIDSKIPTTFFEVFSLKKIKYFIALFSLKKNAKNSKNDFKPIIEVESFAYSGTFLPIQAVRDALLPDTRLFTYGDDIEYSWGVRKAGYKIFLCATPIIHDIDLTFQNSHLLDLFSPTMSDFKVFFRMRNAALISAKNTKPKILLAANIAVWFIGLCGYAFYKSGLNSFVWERAILIFKALYRGFSGDFSIPNYISVPGNIQKP